LVDDLIDDLIRLPIGSDCRFDCRLSIANSITDDRFCRFSIADCRLPILDDYRFPIIDCQ